MIRIVNMRNKEWTCCFGLHVRTATILIGVWHLFLNVLALGFLAVIVRNPSMINELQNNDDQFDAKEPALPTPLSVDQQQYAYRGHSLDNHNIDMSGLVCLCMIAITLMLIYGTIKGKASHILPFFCLQLFDFAITTLTAAGYLCYLRSIHRIIAESHRLTDFWRDELLKLSPQALSIVVLCSFISIVFLKAYAISIVFRCYKFLAMRQHNRSVLPYIIPDVSHIRQDRDYNSLLPDYDEAVLKQPPPSYSVAVATVPQSNFVSPSTSSQFETTAPPPAYSALQQNCNITEERAVEEPQSSLQSEASVAQTNQQISNNQEAAVPVTGNDDTQTSGGHTKTNTNESHTPQNN